MEKDSARHYRAYEGFKPANNGNTSSLKRSTSDRSKTHPSRQVRCLCFGGVPDKASQHSFLKGCIINLGICALLVAYTLLGSFIFLAIEGGTDAGIQQRTLATTIAGNQPTRRNTTAWLKQVSAQLLISTRRFFFSHPFPSLFLLSLLRSYGSPSFDIGHSLRNHSRCFQSTPLFKGFRLGDWIRVRVVFLRHVFGLLFYY